MNRETLIYVDLEGSLTCWDGRALASARIRKARVSNTAGHGSKILCLLFEPALKAGPGAFHTPAVTPIFGTIDDAT